MVNRKLGTTDLEISPLGMGTIQMTRLPWTESLDVIRGVHDLGVNWFDTAQGYLDSELRLGEALRGTRNKVVLITKSGASDSDTLAEHVEASLRRLETDYIDVFFLHGGSAVMADDFSTDGGLLEAASRFVEQGKIRYLGFSAHRPEVALRALDFPQFRVAMIPANYINREYIDGEFMPKAIVGQVAVMAMKPFGGGRILQIGPCLRFLRTYPDLIPCVGVDSVTQMAENIAIWEHPHTLDDSDCRILEEQKQLLGDRFCRLCGYCLPCPEDIPIPTVNFLKVHSMQMPVDRVVTESHSDAVDKARSCTECRQCVDRCPYDLDIPSLLKENSAFYHEFAAKNA
jgi:uncharacterized protein